MQSSEKKKPNVFQRLWHKLDAKMKAKADAGGSSCCSDDSKQKSGSGNKCC